jgi:prepilin-type N-terminal cleavage/methylation domain-containing protein
MKQGLYGWLSKNLKGRKGQRGFTLIELLVVVTILGVLAAIVTLSLVGLTTNATVQSCNTEYKSVQAAMDAYMASQNLAILPVNARTDASGAQVAFTNDMTNATPAGPGRNGSVPLFNANLSPTSPYNYTRNGTTQFYYTWDQFGRITNIGSNSGGSAVSGCVPK